VLVEQGVRVERGDVPAIVADREQLEALADVTGDGNGDGRGWRGIWRSDKPRIAFNAKSFGRPVGYQGLSANIPVVWFGSPAGRRFHFLPKAAASKASVLHVSQSVVRRAEATELELSILRRK